MSRRQLLYWGFSRHWHLRVGSIFFCIGQHLLKLPLRHLLVGYGHKCMHQLRIRRLSSDCGLDELLELSIRNVPTVDWCDAVFELLQLPGGHVFNGGIKCLYELRRRLLRSKIGRLGLL